MIEFTPEMRDSEKLRRYYGFTLFTDRSKAVAHLKKLKGAPYFMSNRRIAELADICESNLSQIYHGRRGASRDYARFSEIHRDTEAAILGVRPEINPPLRGGAHMDPVGARRRLQALIALGFPMRILSEGIDWGKDPQPVHRFVTGKSGRVYIVASTYYKIKALYEKLHDVRPEDMGLSKVAIGRARRSAVLHGYAPSSCWDDDTIDDPSAFPEWTGACGTPEGFPIHLREEIPACEPCKAAAGWKEREHGTLNGGKLRAMMELRQMDAFELARRVGVSDDAIRRWVWEQRHPSMGNIRTMASELRCQMAELMDGYTLDEDPDIRPEDFKGALFRTMIKDSGRTVHQLAREAGFSHTTLYNWIKGRKYPDMERIQKVAKVMEVDWKDFYR
ncbi:helix-turn-helix transcriptional regulator [Streptomyces sp. S1]|uniref:helix-turn-helix transcriptional regulator n=1 Tax=Streptomyces sp. S1 TaxID=718288 RepID=UPI003D71EE3E